MTINQTALAGFCVRCRKDGQAYFCDAGGKVTLPDSNTLKPEGNWPAADWYSYTIALGSGKTVAAAVIDDPGNPRTTWHEPRSVAFLNPWIVAAQAVSIPAGQPLILRHRVVAHDGEFDGATLKRLAAEWLGTH